MFIEPILIVAMILTFMLSFWTGFTDAAYAISTVIGTRTLKPIQAVGMATVANFVGMSFGTAVAFTIGTGIIAPEIASGEVIIAALVGALIFDVIASFHTIHIQTIYCYCSKQTF
jgi:PiT family inorganic phosphate transporter